MVKIPTEHGSVNEWPKPGKRSGGSAMSKCEMQKSYIALPVAESLIYLPDFNKIWYKRSFFNAVLEGFIFSKILKFRGSYEDKQYEQNNLEEKVSHNLQNLTSAIRMTQSFY